MAKHGYVPAHLIGDPSGDDAPHPGHRGEMPHAKPRYILSENVLISIMETIGSRRAESGGVLGGDRTSNSVSAFHFDDGAKCNAAAYSPDHHYLNTVLFPTVWKPQGIKLIGFVHSHPSFIRRPSGGDLIYAEAILKAIPELDSLFVPIVMTVPDTGRFAFLPYAVIRQEKGVAVVDAECRVIHQDGSITALCKANGSVEEHRRSQQPHHHHLEDIASKKDRETRADLLTCERAAESGNAEEAVHQPASSSSATSSSGRLPLPVAPRSDTAPPPAVIYGADRKLRTL